eukprot:gene3821-4172_t
MGNRNAKVYAGDITQSPLSSPSNANSATRRKSSFFSNNGNNTTTSSSPSSSSSSMIDRMISKKDWKALQRLLQMHPDQVSQPQIDKNQLTPSQRALVEKAPSYILETILSIDPQQAVYPDLNQVYLIHYVIQYQSTFAIFQTVTRFDMKAFDRLDGEGHNILYYAAKYHPPLEVLEMILKTRPLAIECKLPSGELPIHIAASSRAPGPWIDRLATAYPSGVRQYYQGYLPIHIACKVKASVSTVKSLLTSYPDSIDLPTGELEMLPIHVALANKCQYDVIEVLVIANRENLLIRDKTYSMPLHHALEKLCNDDIILFLLRQYPEIACHRGKGTPGEYPLAIAIEQGYHHNVINEMIHCYPHAVQVKTVYGMFLLRHAIRRKIDVESIISLLTIYPQAASERDETTGRIALHYAASRLYPITLVTCLLDSYPIGINTIDYHNQQLPIHLLALRSKEDMERNDLITKNQLSSFSSFNNYINILLLFLNRYPQAINITDRYGLTVINYFIENNSPLILYQHCIQANHTNPSSCLMLASQVSSKLLPLHHAITCNRDLPLITLLVQTCPKSAEIPNASNYNRLPLHAAILRPLCLESLLVIFDAFPQVAFVKDDLNKLPIHYALEMHTELPLVRKLLTMNSSIVHDIIITTTTTTQPPPPAPPAPSDDNNSSQHESSSSSLPECCRQYRLLNMAIDFNCQPDIIAEIAQYTMPYHPISYEVVLDQSHHYLWSHLLSHTEDRYWQSIEILLNHYPQDIIYKLTMTCDRLMNKCIDIATPYCRNVLIHRLHYLGRFELQRVNGNNYVHLTKKTIVKQAIDYYHQCKDIVYLKFSQCQESFQRELHARKRLKFYPNFIQNSQIIENENFNKLKIENNINNKEENQYILPLVLLVNGDEDFQYREESKSKGYEMYPYLIITQGATCTLQDMLVHNDFAGKDLRVITQYSRHLLEAIQYLHQVGLVHGNIHVGHVFYYNGRLVLGDFDHSADMTRQETIRIDSKQRTLAYASPEIAHYLLTLERKKKSFKDYDESSSTTSTSTSSSGLVAKSSMDLWSIGSIIYHMITSEPLFLTTSYHDIDNDQIEILSQWPEPVKKKRMNRIVQYPIVRNLLEQIFFLNPEQRPEVSYCLSHPLFHHPHHHGHGSNNSNDDNDDMVGSGSGSSGSDGIRYPVKMTQCKAMGIVLSRYAINSNTFSIGQLEKTSSINSFLFELRLVMELRSRDFLEHGVYIIAIGDCTHSATTNTNTANTAARPIPPTPQQQQQQQPNSSKLDNQLENTIESTLLAVGMGSRRHHDITIRELFRYLLDLPTFHILGRKTEALKTTCYDIHNVLMQIEGQPRTSTSTSSMSVSMSRPLTSATFQRMLNGRIPTPDINSRVPTNWLKDREEPLNVPPSPLRDLSITDLLLAQSQSASASALSVSVSAASGSNPMSSLSLPNSPLRPSSSTKPTSQQKSRKPTTLTISTIPERPFSSSYHSNSVDDDERDMDGNGNDDGNGDNMLVDNDIRFFNVNSNSNSNGYGNGNSQVDNSTTPNSWIHPLLTNPVLTEQQQQLPYFTDMVYIDKSKTEGTLQFLWEKMEVKETEVNNMQVEMALMEEKIRLQNMEIQRLRELVRVTDPKRADS